jgi:hypothetical protein
MNAEMIGPLQWLAIGGLIVIAAYFKIRASHYRNILNKKLTLEGQRTVDKILEEAKHAVENTSLDDLVDKSNTRYGDKKPSDNQ